MSNRLTCRTERLAEIERMSFRSATGMRVMEIADRDTLYADPLHPYTRALLASVPRPDPDHPLALGAIRGEIGSAMAPPPGCRFHPRCPVVASGEAARLGIETACRTQALPVQEYDDYPAQRPNNALYVIIGLIALVALGFGTQMGLYQHVRRVVRGDGRAAAVTAGSTASSTTFSCTLAISASCWALSKVASAWSINLSTSGLA